MQLCDHGISEIFLYHNKSKERLLEYANNIQKSCSAKLHFNYIKPEQMRYAITYAAWGKSSETSCSIT